MNRLLNTKLVPVKRVSTLAVYSAPKPKCNCFLLRWIKKVKVPKFNVTTLIVGGGVFSSVVLAYSYLNVYIWWQGKKMASVFQKGQNSYTSQDLNVTPVERKSGEKKLKLEIIPTMQKLTEYPLVFGERGTGKTTTCKKIAREAKKGVVFVEFESGDKHLGEALADAFDVSNMYAPLSFNSIAALFNLLPKVKDSNNSKQLVNTLMPMINKAALEYKKRNNGVPPVLIIDNVNTLLKQEGGKESLIQLMDWAKECVDKDLLLIVFVSSDGPTVEVMQSQSTASRMKWVELSDMEDDEAVDFVLSCMGDTRSAAINADPTAIAKLKEVVTQTIGGRALLLCSLANYLKIRDDYSAAAMNDFVNNYMSKVKKDFVLSGMAFRSEAEHKAAMWTLADQLLASPTFSVHEEEADISTKDLAFLKTTDVFSIHHGNVRFNTRAHRNHAIAMKQREN